MTRVLDRLEDVDLLHHLALGALLLNLVLVCGLDSNELPGQPMQAKIDFAKRALAEYLAYFI